jgi:hypothetical protein
VIQRFLAAAGLCVLLVVLGGCSKRYRIEIQSDTCWDGSVDNTAVFSGCGNSTYKVIGPMRCVVLSKQTPIGYLRVRIDGRAWTETSAPYGSLEACE